ncbi:hypothetical protein P8X24_00120 [Pyrococcus kukulkanii]|uniref:hypothetical protein n=1 Tax=Pyrococcus kukulkanii TaxID=1609559 RepID=UPI0035684102
MTCNLLQLRTRVGRLIVVLVGLFVLGFGGAFLNISFDNLFQKVPLERLGRLSGEYLIPWRRWLYCSPS